MLDVIYKQDLAEVKLCLKKNTYLQKMITKCIRPRSRNHKVSLDNEPASFISILYVPKLLEKIKRIHRKFKNIDKVANA